MVAPAIAQPCTVGEPPCSAAASYHFELFSAPRGSLTMVGRVQVGPFRDIAICYSVGALAINALNEAHPDTDFMGRCDGGVLLSGRTIAERALELLPHELGR